MKKILIIFLKKLPDIEIFKTEDFPCSGSDDWPPNHGFYIMPKIRSIDLDDIEDFEITKKLLK